MALAVRDGIAVVTFENPPVNAFSTATLTGILSALDEAQADPSVRAIVLTGANGVFSGGADMKSFHVVPRPRPTLRDLIDRLETSEKPIVAAIDGFAVGGGLEVSLTCDYRVATPRARLGLPEIQRGILPGAGGTGRATRLIGPKAALDLILSGDPVNAQHALQTGLIDRIASGDVVDEAVALAIEAAGKPRRRASEMRVRGDYRELFAAARANAAPEARGGLAPHRAIDCIEDALELPFAQSDAREAARFLELLDSEQSKSRIHLFFAERAASKMPDGYVYVPVRRAAVIGSGTMGGGIAMSCANAGIDVTITDVNDELLQRARTTIAGNYASSVKKGKLAQSEMDARLARIAFTTSLEDAVRDVELVIEAVFEEMDVKKDVFRRLDAAAPAGAILATNTSTLDVDAIAAVTSRPQDVVGLHFFSPANVMRLLEIVRGARTSEETLARALGIAKQLKKVAVVAGNCDGFIGNRMLYAYRREAEFLLEEGATPEQVDAAVRDFGLPMGPFAMADLAGLDIGWRIRKRRYAEHPPQGRVSRIADTLCEMGRFGLKTGAGWYRYEPGSRVPLPDPAVHEIIERASREAGIERRSIGAGEIVRRCFYPLVQEGYKILDEGIAARPGDIDVVYVYGYGWPAWRGGPMHWAQTIGLPQGELSWT